LTRDWASFKAMLGRNIKESLRKCYNSLKRAGLSHSLHVASDGHELEEGLDDFFRLHSARADLRGTVDHADLFRNGARRAFLRDVCRRFSQRGQTRIFRLIVGERVVAARIGFAIGDSLYLYYSGYDPAFAQYSVMTTTVAEAVQYAFAEGYRQVNLSTGNDPSKQRWNPREWWQHEAISVSPNTRGRLTYGAFRFASETLAASSAYRHALRYIGRPQE
jgi:CelD/BcsL family acetyltransferase involved in cellulose biosynthesis